MNHTEGSNKPSDYIKGRGAQFNTANKFLNGECTREHMESIDDWEGENPQTTFLEVDAKSLVNKVESPDVGMFYSMNPYMGCEHGCIYCYARNSFEYWGYSAGLDFETKIMVKKNAPQLLRTFLMNPRWKCVPISISGNTDCYQPAERKYRITRALLEVCLEFQQPVALITKNAAVLQDKDILQKLAEKNLVSVLVSTTSLDEKLRRVMEPRTATALQRFRVMKELSDASIKTGVMLGPMIPGLNEHFLHDILKLSAENGATFSAYTFIRLNGSVKLLFRDWLYKNFPDRGDKVWHLIEQSHGGKVNDSRWGTRMRGEGPIAEIIKMQYKKYIHKYGLDDERMGLDTTIFRRPGAQGKLF